MKQYDPLTQQQSKKQKNSNGYQASNREKNYLTLWYDHLTSLNTMIYQVLYEIEGHYNLKWSTPWPQLGNIKPQDTFHYYHFYKNHNHTIDECQQLKNVIE